MITSDSSYITQAKIKIPVSALFRVTVGVVFLEALVLNMLHLHCKALKSSNTTVYIIAASIKKF